jgi:myo-inositol 2-dehydrogenase/D-chiro-inositol 1-dehydrogenase
MLIDALKAGKDVYVEKPITLTIDEGKEIRKTLQATGRVVQVGSWQRSDHRFRTAVEMVRQGRIGTLQRVEVALGSNEVGGPFPAAEVPKGLNWERWLGQAPLVPYTPERCHYTFRWWLDYAGGKMTDHGAHHLDIAQWGIGADPIEILPDAEMPTVANGYNVPTRFRVTFRYPGGVEMLVTDEGRNGVLFEGSAGRLFVNRGSLTGSPVDDLAEHPLPREAFTLYDFDNLARPERAGKIDAIVNHMGNFFDCVAERRLPISDAESQHRSATTCHLGNIACRLGRPLSWDASAECFVSDDEANSLLSRPQRVGYEVRA